MDENTEIVVMLRDAEGLLSRELASVRVERDAYLLNIAAEEHGDAYRVRAKVTTERDVADWEFNAIYDYYDDAVYADENAACAELEDCENPAWALTFPWDGDEDALEAALNRLLALHAAELASVYEAIAPLMDEYTD